MDADSYTVAETARVIGRSTKRVRQMLAEGKLAAIAGSQPLRIPAQQVHDMRANLRGQGSRPGPAPVQPAALTFQQVMELVESLTTRAIEAAAADRAAADRARDAVEQSLRDALAESRAHAQALEARLAAQQQAARAAQQASRRGWRNLLP